jgi:hypothetical protein
MYEVIVGGFSNKDNWDVWKNDKLVFRGSCKEVLRYCVKDLGFLTEDFERAVSSLIYNSHNVLNFDRSRQLVSTAYKPKKTG